MSRLTALREKLNELELGLDAILVTKPENRRYISGFTGTSGYALITERDAFFFTDFRYIEQARSECPGWQIVKIGDTLIKTVADTMRDCGIHALAFEKSYVTYGDVEQYRAWETTVPDLRLEPTEGLVESLRSRKDDDELAKIIRAAEIADETFRYMLGVLRPGMTEQQAALELEYHMRQIGASGPSFTTIVASGWRSALPHGVASEKVLESGDFVTMDFGAVYDGYVSDLTRTVCLGTPSDKQRSIYYIVLEAQLRGLEAAAPGLTGKQLDAIARDYIKAQGHGDAFGHSLGHGIGLEIHEDPRVSVRSDDILLSGMVITIEPGIYLPGYGGVRIEDDVFLSDTGSRILTHSPKELICLS